MEDKDYMGLKIKGFKFSNDTPCGYCDEMDDYIDAEGTIAGNYEHVFMVKFKNANHPKEEIHWSYPKDLVKQQILENNKTLEDIFKDFDEIIKKLI